MIATIIKTADELARTFDAHIADPAAREYVVDTLAALADSVGIGSGLSDDELADAASAACETATTADDALAALVGLTGTPQRVTRAQAEHAARLLAIAERCEREADENSRRCIGRPTREKIEARQRAQYLRDTAHAARAAWYRYVDQIDSPTR